MTRNLRDELSALADEGVGQMAAADALADRMSARFVRARGRRPAIIAGTTCLVLATAGAAAAGVALFRVEVTDLPDRITAGAAAPAAPSGLRCGRELGEVWPTWKPLLLGAGTTGTVHVSTFDAAQAEAGEIFPQMYMTSGSTEHLAVTMNDTAGLYLVQDGMVVAQPGSTGTAIDETIEPTSGAAVWLDRPVMCDGTLAPDGTYEAYGSVEVTVHDGESAGTYDIVGGPWTVELGPPVAPPVAPAEPGIPGLTNLVEGASVPQCGAQVGPLRMDAQTWSTGSDDRLVGPQIGWSSVDDPATTPVEASGRSTLGLRPRVLGGTLTGYPTTTVALVIVTEGVVVGTSSPDGPGPVPATTSSDLAGQDEASGTVLYRACSADATDAGPLPAGRYSVWATQTFHVTERAVAPTGGGSLVPKTVDEDVVAHGRVTDLWIGADGRPVANPGPAAGWPAAIPQDVAVAGTGEELSVVWFSPTVGADPSESIWRDVDQEMLAEAGYSSAEMPVACQPLAHAVLNLPKASTDATGVGVVFATRDEADAFVTRLDVYGRGTIVEGEVSCDLG